jgi:2-oxo-4-hydroxy-4-carboxy--5-ureidoimidazoline (OHCU) decarboxylase
VAAASDDVLNRLAEGNRRYRERFGYTFIVRATGRSTTEMLRLLEERLENDPSVEIGVAAEEQAQITALRLQHADRSG